MLFCFCMYRDMPLPRAVYSSDLAAAKGLVSNSVNTPAVAEEPAVVTNVINVNPFSVALIKLGVKVFWTLKLGRCRPQFTLRNSGRSLGESGECVGKWQSSCILFKGTSINLSFIRMQSSVNTGLHFVRNLWCHYIWNLDLQSVFEIRLGNDWEGHANLKLCIVKQEIDYGVPREMASVFHHSHVATQLCTFCSLWLTLHPCLVSVLWSPRQSSLSWNWIWPDRNCVSSER